MAKRTNSAIFEYQNKNGQTLYGFYIYLGTDKLTKKKSIQRDVGLNPIMRQTQYLIR